MRVACLWFKNKIPVEKVAENCLRFSPQICVRKDHAVFIEIGKCRRLYSEESFMLRLQVILRRLDFSADIAFGSDIPDSLALAKFKGTDLDSLPLEALLELADPFAKDPVVQKYVLKLISSFKYLGIKTLRDFKRVPLPELITRFGPIGILCLQRAKGEMTLPWPTWKPAEIILEKEEFPYLEFYGELAPILFSLKGQLDRIFSRLFARDLKAQRLQVKIFCETNSRQTESSRNFDFEFLFPQSTTKGALNVINERLTREFQLRPIKTPIEALETVVTGSVAGSAGQKSLLHNRDETTEQLYSLLNQLRESQGRENVFQAALTENYLPEKSWKKLEGAYSDQEPEVILQGRIPIRPTYLMKPEKVEVTSGLIYIRKKPFKIQKWLGSVEKISGGWFENQSGELMNRYDRTYFQAELESGTRLSVFQHPDQTYYLHGYFG